MLRNRRKQEEFFFILSSNITFTSKLMSMGENLRSIWREKSTKEVSTLVDIKFGVL